MQIPRCARWARFTTLFHGWEFCVLLRPPSQPKPSELSVLWRIRVSVLLIVMSPTVPLFTAPSERRRACRPSEISPCFAHSFCLLCGA